MRQDGIRCYAGIDDRRWTHIAELVLHLLMEVIMVVLLLCGMRMLGIILGLGVEIVGGKAGERCAFVTDGNVRRGDTAAVAVIRRITRGRLVGVGADIDVVVPIFRAARFQVPVESFEKLARRRRTLRYGY